MASGAAVPGFAGMLVSHSKNLDIWATAAVGTLIALVLSSAFAKAAEDAASKNGWGTWQPNVWTIVNVLGVGIPSFLGYIFLVVIKAQTWSSLAELFSWFLSANYWSNDASILARVFSIMWLSSRDRNSNLSRAPHPSFSALLDF
jgi:hypothetical protein